MPCWNAWASRGAWAITPRRCRAGSSSAWASRAFIAGPQVVFADEPTGNLDSRTKVEVMEMICDFAHARRQTIVLVTHDDHMARYADRIVTLFDGRIVDDTLNTH